MGEVVHNKLVRDKIPDIIRADHAEPVFRTLNDDEYRRMLLEKLVEEAIELRDSDGDLGERADVAEVLRSLDAVLGYSPGIIELARDEKAQERGGFDGRIFLEKVVEIDE